MGFEKSNSVRLDLISKEKNVTSKIFDDVDKKHLYTPDSIYQTIQVVRLQLASSDIIKKWAEKKLPNGKFVGQVTNANTLHHKTFKPLKGGLFCERIFGPTKDFQCSCGKKKKPLDLKLALIKDVSDTSVTNSLIPRQFCPVCDVEYTWSVIRRYQLGFIELVMPVAHVWYFQNSPSYLSVFLDFKKKNLESILYCSVNMTLENIQFIKSPLSNPALNAFKYLKPIINKKPTPQEWGHKQPSSRKQNAQRLGSTRHHVTHKPKRVNNWRNLNFKNFFSTKVKVQIPVKEMPFVPTPTKILLKFKNFQKHITQVGEFHRRTLADFKNLNKEYSLPSKFVYFRKRDLKPTFKVKTTIWLQGFSPIRETSFKAMKRTLASFHTHNVSFTKVNDETHFKNSFLLAHKKAHHMFLKIKIVLYKNSFKLPWKPSMDSVTDFKDSLSLDTKLSKTMYNGNKKLGLENSTLNL